MKRNKKPFNYESAGDNTIDVYMILIAQALSIFLPNVVIATTNVGHLSRFIQADLWQNIGTQ